MEKIVKRNDIPLVCDLDLEKYLGIWYEIAKLSTKEEAGMDNVEARYSLKDNGKVKVHNLGYKNGKQKGIKGSAWLQDDSCTGGLFVRFFWPFKSEYNVIKLAPDYRYAVVMGKKKDKLWILSRTAKMKRADYKAIMKFLKAYDFDTKAIMKTKQNRNN